MAYSSVQKIREFAGIQSKAYNLAMLSTGNSSVWTVDTDDPIKIVANLDNGATVPSTGDVVVKVNGVSVGVSAIDQDTGNVTIATGTSSGATVLANFASSPLTDRKVFDFMIEANSIVNGYIANQYSLPLGACIPFLAELEMKLGAGNLMKSSYGTSAQDLAEDGFRLQQDTMEILQKIADGDIELVDDTGTPVTKKDDVPVPSTDPDSSNSRTKGYLFSPDNEEFYITPPEDIEGRY